MCCGCYAEAGWPRDFTPEVVRAATLINKTDEFGPLHIIVGDWNLEDDHIAYCAAIDEPKSDAERCLIQLLLPMTMLERATAMALADGYLLGDGSYSQAAIDMGAPA